jgi:uncharacterized membrane protein
MNLDLLPLGWVHFLASVAAMVTGAVVLMRPKGTEVHKARGRMYVAAMALTSLTALGIYRRGVFFFPHWLALAGLIITAAGIAAAHFKVPRAGWIHLHLTCMAASFYLLIGGAVNEAFLRVNFLQRLVPDFNSSFAVGMTQLSVMLLFAALIGYFNIAAAVRAHGRIEQGSVTTGVRKGVQGLSGSPTSNGH